jgi:hypothetical protein
MLIIQQLGNQYHAGLICQLAWSSSVAVGTKPAGAHKVSPMGASQLYKFAKLLTNQLEIDS